MNEKRKNEILALALTLLLSAGVLLILFNSYMTGVSLSQDDQTELKQDTIMFGGEYVALGDMPDATDSEDLNGDNHEADQPEEVESPEIDGDDLNDSGEPTKEPAPVVTDTKESPMKVKEKPKEEPAKKPGPAVSTKPDDKKAQVKTNPKPSSETDKRMKNAFGSSGGSGSGKQGSPNGNTEKGVNMDKPGLGGLNGYTLENWAKPNPNSRWSGTVKVKVRVNARGKVTEAHAEDGSGEANSHAEIRRACEEAAKKSSFSVPNNTTTEGVGFITYKWK